MHAQQYILIEQKILLSDVVKYAKLQIQISFSYTFFSGCWWRDLFILMKPISLNEA